MHVLISVFFKAVHGGLHENVLATSVFLLREQHQVTVVCPPGPLADSLPGYGIGVVETDFSEQSQAFESVLAVHAKQPVDLVHAHPFASRKLGLEVAERLNVPFLLTLHGKYTDDLANYIDRTAAVLAVSPGVRDFVLSQGVGVPEKLTVIPNAPDASMFSPSPESAKSNRHVGAGLRAALVSRLDRDKTFILDVFADAVAYAARVYPGKVSWTVVGDGTESEGFRARLEELRGENTVEFCGWLEGSDLRDAYRWSDFVYAPGRCALEAMSCGVPAIAVGSKGYCGLVQSDTWQQAVYSNFGGVGNRHEDYQPGMTHQDLDRLFSSEAYREGLGHFGKCIIAQFFNAEQAHQQLLEIYQLAIMSHALTQGVMMGGFATSDNKKANQMSGSEFEHLEKVLVQAGKENAAKLTRDLITVQNRLYAQLEGLSWLQRRLAIKGQLPPLRGWATSPDVLLLLHTHIMATRPRLIVECGSGASTLVIADALNQNGFGELVSLEHSGHYGAKTLGTLQAESLEDWVDLRIGDLEAWEGEHLNPEGAEKPSRWYPVSLLEDLESVDLLWVDGPPGATCLFSRYPALPALANKLAPNAEVWLDDTIGQEEKDICERWAKDHGFELEYYALEKGLGRLMRPGSQGQTRPAFPVDSAEQFSENRHPEQSVGLDFSLPDEERG